MRSQIKAKVNSAEDKAGRQEPGRAETKPLKPYREEIPDIVERLVRSCREECLHQVRPEPLPCRPAVIEFIDRAARLVFPGYFTRARVDAVNLGYYLGQEAIALFEVLAEQIALALRHEGRGRGLTGARSEERGQAEALHFLHHLPRIRGLLATDVRAAYEGDPAAKSYDEIIFCYPGLFATLVYRLAHQLYRQQVPLLPRIMTEYAHSRTGIDIHPGARIGESFFMDHGTGVVVGETTEIGHRVRLYQGVTLGALSLPKDAVESLRNKKRHPTVEDDVIIYAGATILGGNTVIGARSVIGGNVWLTDSIPPDTRVLIKKPELVYQGNSQARTKAVVTGKTKPIERLDKQSPEPARYHAAPEVL